MTVKFAAALLFSLAACGAAYAQRVEVDPGLMIAPQTNVVVQGKGQNGRLSAQILVTDDAEQLRKLWNSPDPSVKLNVTSAATAGKPVHVFIMLTGCSTDSQGKCNVRVVYKSLTPGQKTHSQSAPEYLVKAQPFNQDALLSTAHTVAFAAEDAPGAYTVVAQLVDVNDWTGLEIQQPVHLMPAKR
ncbi:hypothetical protein [Massilia endophytica]|uniref:hypothetical protein n=1 Tax=Massilia endophytica TaxID=2899220 RepID=UPI001E468917|nr:hypothetical protein [Massilia endophytica]UGQ47157.1 hypothetical protein LSQ66_01375 [Massilia endophytica]